MKNVWIYVIFLKIIIFYVDVKSIGSNTSSFFSIKDVWTGCSNISPKLKLDD